MYELLSGHCVFFENMRTSQIRESFRDNPVMWIEAHARREPVSLHRHAHCRDVPASLAELVFRCLEKDPLLRPRSAGDLSTALGEIMHYDLGMAMGATVRIIHPYGGYEDRLIFPGSHRIGSSSECEIRLPSAGIAPLHAVLDWAGLPEYPHLRPLRADGTVRVSGKPIERSQALGPHDVVQVGNYELALEYPTV